MKSLPAIGFLVLLLYHLIGLPLAVLTFEESYESTTQASASDEWKVVKLPISLPYTSSWQNPDGQDGLVQDGDDFYNIVHQEYANDTLYTLLKTNQNAKERFVELAEQWQQDVDEQGASAKNPLAHLIKLLKSRLTTFLLPVSYSLPRPLAIDLLGYVDSVDVPLPTYSVYLAYNSPPPEK
ncbi:hypothetical protein GO730_34585 [Spirosoma sp. HMF3257]|uniref:Uncharacterized protein n=1 Tax=Spirosoma telluris TaxID=2183553 RepID=A0A327NVA2_9BACT|nr:hypothetical protein [Spirosoma telluris]RAI77936.1 hypothetical protein HMF3257_34485 [Spirosoma telluris]